MKLGQIEQQPRERRSYSIAYELALDDGDKVESAEGAIEPPGTAVVESVGVFDDGQRVRFWLRGGAHGDQCKVTITAITKGGEKLEDEIAVKIKEV